MSACARATLAVAIALVPAGCARRTPLGAGAALDAGADPAIGHFSPVGPASAFAPAPPPPSLDEEAASPTAEEAAQTPMPRFAPIVPNPSMRSKLPCPPGTTLSVLETSIECRLIRPKNLFFASEGPALAFYPSGKLASQGHHSAGKPAGHWWYFREDGTLDYEVDFVDGEWDGVYVQYWPSGARHEEHHEKAGVHEGPAKIWDERGRLLSWSLYAGDHVVRTKSFR